LHSNQQLETEKRTIRFNRTFGKEITSIMQGSLSVF
jgi:hypothetical protein